jgi:hypothetical protein
MGQMVDILDIGEEQDDDELDTEDTDLLTQAQRILFRLVMQEDPAELRRVASRYLADSMSPAAVRAALGAERQTAKPGDVSEAA